jgi:hypothetical protein
MNEENEWLLYTYAPSRSLEVAHESAPAERRPSAGQQVVRDGKALAFDSADASARLEIAQRRAIEKVPVFDWAGRSAAEIMPPTELVVLNCWVTDTNDASCATPANLRRKGSSRNSTRSRRSAKPERPTFAASSLPVEVSFRSHLDGACGCGDRHSRGPRSPIDPKLVERNRGSPTPRWREMDSKCDLSLELGKGQQHIEG